MLGKKPDEDSMALTESYEIDSSSDPIDDGKFSKGGRFIGRKLFGAGNVGGHGAVAKRGKYGMGNGTNSSSVSNTYANGISSEKGITSMSSTPKGISTTVPSETEYDVQAKKTFPKKNAAASKAAPVSRPSSSSFASALTTAKGKNINISNNCNNNKRPLTQQSQQQQSPRQGESSSHVSSADYSDMGYETSSSALSPLSPPSFHPNHSFSAAATSAAGGAAASNRPMIGLANSETEVFNGSDGFGGVGGAAVAMTRTGWSMQSNASTAMNSENYIQSLDDIPRAGKVSFLFCALFCDAICFIHFSSFFEQ